mgnify:CR=1 FL=1
MQFALSQDFVFQFSSIVHNGFAFLIGKPFVLMSKSSESFADVHQVLDFFSHVHIHGYALYHEISETWTSEHHGRIYTRDERVLPWEWRRQQYSPER